MDGRLKLSWRKKTLFACVAAVLFFAGLEAILTVLGIPAEHRAEHPLVVDPYVGFSSWAPLMQLQPAPSGRGEAVMETSPAKLRWFNSQSFTAEKPSGVKRVFCVGGSTTFGRPFDDSTSYSAYLRRLLPETDPSVRWEVINAGGVSYASYRVALVMEELAEFEPDVFVVYSVHNEFLERRTYPDLIDPWPGKWVIDSTLRRTRTFQGIETLLSGMNVPGVSPNNSPEITALPGDVDERLNHTIGPVDYVRDEEWNADVIRHYRSNLVRMVAIARRAGASIVFIEPASNEKDCSPFKSDDDHFDRGRGMFEVGQFDSAAREFATAIDRDICPLRATSEIAKTVRQVARSADIPLVHFGDRLRAKCVIENGHPCLGNEYFLDHVHPTIDVHRDLATWIIETLVAEEIVAGEVPSSDVVARVDASIRESIDTTAQAIAFRNLAKVMHWAGKFDEARRSAEDALRLAPGDPESQFVLADSLTQLGLPDIAVERYERLFEAIQYERAMLPFAFVLADDGRFESAKFYATLATASEKPRTRSAALALLVEIHTHLGETERADEARRAFESASRIGTLTELLGTDASIFGSCRLIRHAHSLVHGCA